MTGAVKTELGRHLGILHYLALPFQVLVKTPKSGAQTQIMLAVDPDLETVTGKYFADCAIAKESIAAQDDDTAAWLWEYSERITNLNK